MALYTGLLPDIDFPISASNIGFNLVTIADNGGDPDADGDDDKDGTSVVQYEGFDIQEIPKLLIEAGLSLWDGCAGDSIQPVKFSLNRNHPWFQQLVPEDYPHWSVWVCVKGLNYIKTSIAPSGIYQKVIADAIAKSWKDSLKTNKI
jgi:hypothetical protein